MQPVSDTFREAVARGNTRIAEVTILDSNLNPVEGGTLTGEAGVVASGSVTMSRRRDVQRTAQITVANPTGAMTPKRDGLVWWDRLFRIGRGIELSPGQYEVPTLATLIIDEPANDVGAASSIVTLGGADQIDRLLGSKFTTPVGYAAGARLRDVAADLIVDAGGNANHLDLDDAGKTLVVERRYEIGDTRIDALRELMTSFALTLGANAMGRIVMAPAVDPNTAPTAWKFTAGEDAVMTGVSKRWLRGRLYNHVLVTGEAADGSPVYAERWDDDEASPTWIGGPLGDRVYTYTSAMIRTVPMAQAVADMLFMEHVLIEEQVSIPHAPLPFLEPGDAIEIEEPVSDTVGRFFIDDIVIPLGAGPARLTTRRLRSLL